MMLKIDKLVGGYSSVPVLKGISFEVPAGQLVGLIGLNGAGKSTTINHVIGLLRPFSGTITLDSVTLLENPAQYKKSLAYIPETPILYSELNLREHIELTIKAYQLDEKTAWEKANQLLHRFRLADRLDWFPANFSKGMKQKVMIVCAFLVPAKLFVIDEPFLGLDPLAIHDLLELIDEEKKRGAAVLMSTHVLATAEKYCDSFVLINHGQLVNKGTLAELQADFGKPDASLDEIYLTMTQGERQ